MGKPAATMGDKIMATDIHIILIPAPPGPPIPTPLPHPFVGMIDTGCVPTVMIGGKPAATATCGATNTPPHIPQGGPFQIPPTNRATIMTGSATVLIGGKPAARMGDTAITCDDIAPTAPKGQVVGTAVTVLIGG
jgi:uncharacterized Zn-binding protein involved in type VI secretion